MADKIKILQRGTGIQSPGPTPNFSAAAEQMDSSTKKFGEMSAQLGQQAANAFAEKLGYENGATLENEDKSPAVFDVQQHYQNSYNASASNTLNLQAYKLMTDSQVEINKASELSPNLISSYNKNVTDGIKTILDHAPEALKGQLQTKYSGLLLDQNSKFQAKMFKEQLDKKKSETLAASNETIVQAYNLGASETPEIALQLIHDEKEHNKLLVEQGLSTPEQARASNEAVSTNAWSGIYIRKAQAAIDNNNIDKYMADISGTMPENAERAGMDPATWASVQHSVQTYVNQQENLKSRADTTLIAQTKLAINSNPNFSPAQIQALKTKLPKDKYLAISSYYIEKAGKRQALKFKADMLSGSFSNTSIYMTGTDAEKNEAWGKYVDEYQQQGNGLWESQTLAASTAGGPVPAYITLLKGNARSLKGIDLQHLAAGLSVVGETGNIANLEGITPQERAVARSYERLVKDHSSDDAAAIAHNAAFNPNEDALKKQYADYQKSHMVLAGQVNQSFYHEITGEYPKNVTNFPLMRQWSDEEFKDYFYYSNGDVEQAKQLTKESFENTWGYSTINGDKALSYMPVDKLLNLPSSVQPVVHEDMYNQLKSGLQSTNDAYEKGNSNFYYEMDTRLNIKDAIQAADKVAELTKTQMGSRIKSLIDTPLKSEKSKYVKTLKEFNTQGPIKITRVNRDGTREKLKIGIFADPLLARSTHSANPFMGGYNFQILTDTGFMPIMRDNPMGGSMKYKPNPAFIENSYNKIQYHTIPGQLASNRVTEMKPILELAKLIVSHSDVEDSDKTLAKIMKAVKEDIENAK